MEITLGFDGLGRRLVALLIVAVACPLALFGLVAVGCAAQSFSPSCAVNAVLVSPVVLFLAGLGAAVATRGWVGMGFVILGVLAGMAAIPIVSSLAGNPVPIDPVQGVIATIWFMPPVLIGYGAGRGLARLRAGSGSAGTSKGG